jgi:transaldolase
MSSDSGKEKEMETAKDTLQQLYDEGQSPWLDYITRDILKNGRLAALIGQGIVGLTSNPTIFQQAISGSQLYDEELRRLAREGKSVDEIYGALVLDDIRGAAALLRPVYDRTNGRDGLVSIEVSPRLAYDTPRTIAEARRLFQCLNLLNIMIKIPGTREGLPAFQQAISEGINVNVTLLFSLDNYSEVAERYIAGLEERAAAGLPVDQLASVASFFVSRVDTAVDKTLDQVIAASGDAARKDELRALQGTAAIANARLAYDAYKGIFSGPRWDALANKGARTQRCLWASTSTKNPAYGDVMYVEQLIGPDTVDTMPPQTIDAFLGHGIVERTVDKDVEQARAVFTALERVGISMDAVTLHLQQDGVKSFSASFDELIDAISVRRAEMLADAG